MNIKWFTERHQAETMELDISAYQNITGINYKGIRGYGFFPGRMRGEGLFMSVLRKKGIEPEAISGKKPGSTGRITAKDKAIVEEWTRFPSENLIRIGDDLIVPAAGQGDYLSLSGILRIVKAGTRICTVKGDNYLPSHESAMSVYFKKESFPTVDISPEQALSYLSRGQIELQSAKKGWNTVYYNGVNLGYINNIGSRINNYYPVNWRIRMSITQAFKNNIVRWK